MTDEPEDKNRPDNLWQPVAGDFGAHGPYDDRAKRHSPLTWLATHRLLVGGIAALVGAVALASTRSRQGRRSLLGVDQHG